MAIRHADAGEPIDVRPLGDLLPTTPTYALFKSEQLEVMRLVLLAGESLPPHKVPGEITIQCLEGAIEVTAKDTAHILQQGELLYLKGNVVHSVKALENSSALVTIALHAQ